MKHESNPEPTGKRPTPPPPPPPLQPAAGLAGKFRTLRDALTDLTKLTQAYVDYNKGALGREELDAALYQLENNQGE